MKMSTKQDLHFENQEDAAKCLLLTTQAIDSNVFKLISQSQEKVIRLRAQVEVQT